MKNKIKNGYSIIEILVYLTIFTAMSIVVINSFLVMLSSFALTNMNRQILETSSISIERLSREIRQAKSIDPGSTAAILILNSTDKLGNPMVIKFSSENGALNLYKDGNLEGNLLAASLSVSSLTFNYIHTPVSSAVKLNLGLAYTKGKMNKIENFYDTIILRGSY